MANYTIADVKILRDRLGAGMVDSKNALEEADGDIEKAVEILRVKGLKGVAKREGRQTTAGLVAAKPGSGYATLIELASETDFVAKNEKFVALADQVGYIVDSEAGMVEVLGTRAQASELKFTAPAVTALAERSIFRSLQKGEIRQQGRFRERNRVGKNAVHDWPILSLKATGNRKLADDGKEIQPIELEARVEYDRNSIGRERGDVIEIN